MQNPYDFIADKWHANVRDESYVKRVLGYVDRILEGLPSGAKVLDLGCGTGNPIAKHVAQRGFKLTGVDQSRRMLEIAQHEVPQAEFIHADMVRVDLKDQYAAAIAWDSAFHVERKYHSTLYQKLARVLEPEKKLLLSVGGSDPGDFSTSEADVEGFTSEMYGHTFFYSGYDPDVARKLLEKAGFEIELWEVDDASSRGHIAVIARRSRQKY